MNKNFEKCRKIRGVDSKICVAEQKIAYNYAFSWREHAAVDAV